MENLAVTLRCLEEYTEAEKLVIQAQEVKSTAPGTESSYTIATVATPQEAQNVQLLDVRSTFPKEDISDSIQVVLNPPALAALPHILNSNKKGV